MEDYRYLREHIMSGQLSDIELNNVVINETMNRPQGLTASVPLRSEFADEQLLDAWRTALYVVQGDQVIAGGVLEPPRLSLGGNALDLSCFGWTGYFDHRVIRGVGLEGTVGQADPGATVLAKPIDDATATNVGPLPQGSTLWQDVAGGYSLWVGIVPALGHTGAYRSHFSVPTTGLTLHPIQSVTLGIVATLTAFAARQVIPELRIGGTSYQGGGPTLLGGYRPTDCSWTWNANPSNGLPWTPADIYAFATGSNTAGFTTNPASTTFVDLVVNQMWMTVTYGAGFSDTFANTDQFVIFKQLVDDAQNQTKFGLGYDLGIGVVWDQLSGVTRDKQGAYTPWQAKNLGDALRDLAASDNGFDFQMEYALNLATDRVDKQIRLSHPYRGRNTGFLFEYDPVLPGNVIARGFADPTTLAWTGDGWGSGNDATRLKSPYTFEANRGVYPPMDAAPTFSEETIQSSLDSATVGYFNRTQQAHRAPVLRVDPDLDPTWGTYGLGDVVRVRIADGFGSVDDDFRIVGRHIDIDQGQYDLTMVDPSIIGSGEGA